MKTNALTHGMMMTNDDDDDDDEWWWWWWWLSVSVLTFFSLLISLLSAFLLASLVISFTREAYLEKRVVPKWLTHENNNLNLPLQASRGVSIMSNLEKTDCNTETQQQMMLNPGGLSTFIFLFLGGGCQLTWVTQRSHPCCNQQARRWRT